MTEDRLNAYHIMWLFVFFDLPVTTKKEMKAASLFRKNLEKDGFSMMQFSVYIRHCASRESLEVHIKRVKSLLPETGKVSLLSVTDKQYGDIYNFWGKPKSINKSKISKKLSVNLFNWNFFSTFALEYISYSPFLIRKSECYALEFSVFKSIGCGLM